MLLFKQNWLLAHRLCLCFGLVLIFRISDIRTSKVTFTNNGYDNLLVAISSTTPREDAEIVIENIKSMISEASPILYTATYELAYFRSVHILIPDTWSHITANGSSWESFQTADVIIDLPNPAYGDSPYTRQLGGCGDPGDYIHLTPSYVTGLHQPESVNQFGNPGKVFVHEWAHFRYGVFNEYGVPGNESHPLFYRRGSRILPNVCADKMLSYDIWDITDNGTCKIDSSTNLYDANCRFFFDPNFKPLTSLMSYHQIDSVVHFCRDDQKYSHNYDAPNMHNTKCRRRPVWTVIERSPDFEAFLDKKTARVGPLSRNREALIPEFQIVRSAPGARIVLVADVSGSMKNHNRIEKLNESVRSWIKHDLPIGSQLGLIQFSSRAQTLSSLTTIESEESRKMLMDQLPKQVYSATCLGCGLSLGSQMLAQGGPGGIVLLVTDGKNSPGYQNIDDVLPEILEAGIRVITIALGPEADENIENLADLTDGKSYFVRDEETSEGFGSAFLQALTYQSNVASSTDVSIKIYDIIVTDKDTIEDHFKVDLSIGRHLKLKLYNLEDADNLISMELSSPNNQAEWLGQQIEFDGSTAFISLESAQVGEWRYRIKLRSSQTAPLQVTVTTQLVADISAPITTKCWVQNGADIKNASTNPIRVHAQVWKGSNPVIGATVKAYIEKPNDELEILDLLDNGVNADTIANDGVYSKFFANVSQEGRYSLKCQIWDTGTAYVGLGFIASASSSVLNAVSNNYLNHSNVVRESLGNFSRISSGGSFKVNVPVSKDDAYPPGPITDLSLKAIFSENVTTVTLKWTAPGDELDSGTILRYELKYSEDSESLLDDSFEFHRAIISENVIIDGSLHPKEAGSLQEVVFHLENAVEDRSYYFALRAIDKVLKTSPVSNLASLFIPQTKNHQHQTVIDTIINKELRIAAPADLTQAVNDEDLPLVDLTDTSYVENQQSSDPNKNIPNKKSNNRSSSIAYIILVSLTIASLTTTILIRIHRRIRSTSQNVQPSYTALNA